MTIEQAKQLTEAELVKLDREHMKARRKYYKQAEKIADSNDMIQGEWYEDWAERVACEEVYGSEEAYEAAIS